MIISEILYSIQGEGMNAGKPAVFLRFGNCNLNCKWCDSKFARKNNKEVSLDEVVNEIKKYKECKRLVITGGEPMLQQPAIIEIRKKFPDYFIEVETNGSQEAFCFREVDLFNVSYKTSNSGNKPYHLKTNNSKCIYKFVVKNVLDFLEIEKIRQQYNISPGKIYLMPEGITREEILEKHEFIIERCRAKGYNFTTRLQILTWGNIRGK